MLYRIAMLLMTLGDPQPPNHPNFTIFVAFYIFVVSKHRNFKFGTQVGRSYAQHMDYKPSLKGTWLRQVTYCKFAEALPYLSNGCQILYSGLPGGGLALGLQTVP